MLRTLTSAKYSPAFAKGGILMPSDSIKLKYLPAFAVKRVQQQIKRGVFEERIQWEQMSIEDVGRQRSPPPTDHVPPAALTRVTSGI